MIITAKLRTFSSAPKENLFPLVTPCCLLLPVPGNQQSTVYLDGFAYSGHFIINGFIEYVDF